MNLLSSDQILRQIKNIIHKDTQLHENSIDLTVDSIHQFTGAGSLDFGGSELKPAKTERIKAKKKSPDDDYGWWNLKAGTYKAEFNEAITLNVNTRALITLHEHARQAGILANMQLIQKSGRLSVVFEVLNIGCNIKENARMATLHLIQSTA